MLLKSSPDFSEGVLIGGSLQAAGRITQILMGKSIASFSLSGYASMPNWTIPNPTYNVALKQGNQNVATIPASAGQAKPVSSMPGGAATKTMGRGWGARGGHWAA